MKKILIEKVLTKKRLQKNIKKSSVEEKEKKRQYNWDQKRNLSDKEKQKKFEYKRNYYWAHKK